MSDYPKWHNVAETTPLALVHNEIDALRARLDAAGIPQITINDPSDQTEVAKEVEPFVYTEGWDKGFAGEGDPYGISEYTGQSANPDAAPTPASTVADAGFYIEELGPNVFRLTHDTAIVGDFMTRADAEKAEALAKG